MESIAESKGDFELDKEANLFSGMLASDADQNQRQRKKELKASKIYAAKRAKLLKEIFDYIYVAKCQKLFSLAWYDYLTYAQSNDSSTSAIALPTTCCNRLSCSSRELLYTQQEPFIDTTTTKITGANQVWIKCRTLALKQWRTKTTTQLWNIAGVTRSTPKNLILSDCCLIALAKSKRLSNLTELIKFLKPWHGIFKHA